VKLNEPSPERQPDPERVVIEWDGMAKAEPAEPWTPSQLLDSLVGADLPLRSKFEIVQRMKFCGIVPMLSPEDRERFIRIELMALKGYAPTASDEQLRKLFEVPIKSLSSGTGRPAP